MKLYLIGGGSIENIAVKQVRSPSVLIFLWTTKDTAKLKKYRKIMIRHFREIGADKIEFAEYSDTYSEIKDKIRNCNMIYLPGGETELLIKTMRSKRVVPLLRRFDGIIIGVSAGAYALSKKYLKMRNKIKVIPSLNFVNLYMKAHYSEEFDTALLKISKNRKIYGVPDDSALIWDGKSLKYFGSVYLFFKGKKERIN